MKLYCDHGGDSAAAKFAESFNACAFQVRAPTHRYVRHRRHHEQPRQ